jgi:hypothetical protein
MKGFFLALCLCTAVPALADDWKTIVWYEITPAKKLEITIHHWTLDFTRTKPAYGQLYVIKRGQASRTYALLSSRIYHGNVTLVAEAEPWDDPVEAVRKGDEAWLSIEGETFHIPLDGSAEIAP